MRPGRLRLHAACRRDEIAPEWHRQFRCDGRQCLQIKAVRARVALQEPRIWALLFLPHHDRRLRRHSRGARGVEVLLINAHTRTMTEPIASSNDAVRHLEVVDPYDFEGPLFAAALLLAGHYAYAGLATGISLLIGLTTARQIRISTARDGRTYLVVRPLWRRRTADKAVELIGMKLEHWRFGVCAGLELTSSNLCLSAARRDRYNNTIGARAAASLSAQPGPDTENACESAASLRSAKASPIWVTTDFEGSCAAVPIAISLFVAAVGARLLLQPVGAKFDLARDRDHLRPDRRWQDQR